MSDNTPDRLDDLIRHLLARLAEAVDRRHAAWRTPMLASVRADGTPSLRTVVLRSADPERRTLSVYTDRRSDKVAQLGSGRAAELGFWDPAAGEQLRVSCSARVVTDGEAVDAAWAALPEAARAIYLGDTAPGTPLSRPGSGGGLAADPRHEVFAVLQFTWTRWDWLWLGPDGHRRARIAWTADGRCRAEWVEP